MRSDRRTGSISTALYLVLGIGLITLGIGEEIDEKGEINRISVEEGIFSRKIGKVGIVTHYDRISIIVKIPKFIVANKVYVGIRGCLEFPDEAYAAFQNLGKQKEEFVKDRLEVLKEYNNQEEPHKEKRSVWSWLGIIGNAAYTTLVGGLTEVQIRRLNSHVKETQEEVGNMAKTMEKLENQQVIFEKKTLGVITELSQSWKEMFEILECKIELAMTVLEGRMNFIQYMELVDNILYPALSGRNRVLLTSKILDVTTLHKIVKQHPVFIGSVFHYNPALLYSTSYLSLVGVNEDLTVAHLVLEYPVLKQEGYYPLYEISQVGLYLKGNECIYFGIPENVVKRNGEFRDIRLDSCNRHHNLFICPEHVFGQLRSCYQENKMTCTQEQRICSGSFEYIRTDTGILFRSNAGKEIYYRNKGDKISSIKVSLYNVAYVTWKTAKYLQVENTSLMAPGMGDEEVYMTSFNTSINVTSSDMTVANIAGTLNRAVKDYGKSLYSIINETYGNVRKTKEVKDGVRTELIILYVLIGNLYLLLLSLVFWRYKTVLKCNAFSCCQRYRRINLKDKSEIELTKLEWKDQGKKYHESDVDYDTLEHEISPDGSRKTY